MKVVVTGSAGLLGSRVTAALMVDGHDVVATDVRAPDGEAAATTRVIDLCQIEAVRELVTGADVVCHLGNLPSTVPSGRSKGYINNTAANYNVYLAATEAGVRRIVYASSVQAYGCFGFTSAPGDGNFTPPRYLPLDEDHPLQPADAYPLSKATGEWIAASFCRAIPDLTAWSLRFTGIRVPQPPRPPHFGPRNKHGVSPRLMLGGMCTWVHMDDAIRATVLACAADRPGHTPLNIVAQTSRPAWTPEALAALYGSVPEFRRPVLPEQSLVSGDRAEQLLGFRAAHDEPTMEPAQPTVGG
ncbi:MAG TPA: NAD(P)-dependent oxidoreductase [Tepidisphaeraceae bacterium]|jgi:UDP-glucose 4-epimerase|nr:NAD(P)-dependent oxidoreductase [Tepidisphaeraceae bacterium]